MKILHVDSSILGEHSASRELTAAIVRRVTMANSGAEVIGYDLAAEPFGHLGATDVMAFRGTEPQDAAAKQEVVRNAKALDDFLAADVIIIGAPMYNFTLPSQLKAWIDRLLVAGKTFRHTESGVEGLVPGKRVIVASSRGGFYSDGHPTAFLDHQESYLRGVFGFIGITDVTFIRAEGIAISAESRKAALDAATAEVEKLAA